MKVKTSKGVRICMPLFVCLKRPARQAAYNTNASYLFKLRSGPRNGLAPVCSQSGYMVVLSVVLSIKNEQILHIINSIIY